MSRKSNSALEKYNKETPESQERKGFKQLIDDEFNDARRQVIRRQFDQVGLYNEVFDKSRSFGNTLVEIEINDLYRKYLESIKKAFQNVAEKKANPFNDIVGAYSALINKLTAYIKSTGSESVDVRKWSDIIRSSSGELEQLLSSAVNETIFSSPLGLSSSVVQVGAVPLIPSSVPPDGTFEGALPAPSSSSSVQTGLPSFIGDIGRLGPVTGLNGELVFPSSYGQEQYQDLNYEFPTAPKGTGKAHGRNRRKGGAKGSLGELGEPAPKSKLKLTDVRQYLNSIDKDLINLYLLLENVQVGYIGIPLTYDTLSPDVRQTYKFKVDQLRSSSLNRPKTNKLINEVKARFADRSFSSSEEYAELIRDLELAKKLNIEAIQKYNTDIQGVYRPNEPAEIAKEVAFWDSVIEKTKSDWKAREPAITAKEALARKRGRQPKEANLPPVGTQSRPSERPNPQVPPSVFAPRADPLYRKTKPEKGEVVEQRPVQQNIQLDEQGRPAPVEYGIPPRRGDRPPNQGQQPQRDRGNPPTKAELINQIRHSYRSLLAEQQDYGDRGIRADYDRVTAQLAELTARTNGLIERNVLTEADRPAIFGRGKRGGKNFTGLSIGTLLLLMKALGGRKAHGKAHGGQAGFSMEKTREIAEQWPNFPYYVPPSSKTGPMLNNPKSRVNFVIEGNGKAHGKAHGAKERAEQYKKLEEERKEKAKNKKPMTFSIKKPKKKGGVVPLVVATVAKHVIKEVAKDQIKKAIQNAGKPVTRAADNQSYVCRTKARQGISDPACGTGKAHGKKKAKKSGKPKYDVI